MIIAVARMVSKENTVRSTLMSVTLIPAKMVAPVLMESIHIPAHAHLVGLGIIAKTVSVVFNQISISLLFGSLKITK